MDLRGAALGLRTSMRADPDAIFVAHGQSLFANAYDVFDACYYPGSDKLLVDWPAERRPRSVNMLEAKQMSKTTVDESMYRFIMPDAGDEYVRARRQLLDAEIELRDRIEHVAAQRRALPPGPLVRDYEFFDGPRTVKLSELFEDGKPDLFVYHVMYWQDDKEFCPMCSMWIDGLNGIAHHVAQRANIVAASLAPVEALQAWKQRRGWDRIRVLADVDDSFARDTCAQERDGTPASTVLVFEKTPEGVRHSYTAHAEIVRDEQYRGVDQICPTWHVFDLLRSGRGDWHASNDSVIR